MVDQAVHAFRTERLVSSPCGTVNTVPYAKMEDRLPGLDCPCCGMSSSVVSINLDSCTLTHYRSARYLLPKATDAPGIVAKDHES
jgi:hypothetical protein